jgi:RNA polymerase sigma-70 factor (ECF subfamily)
VTVSALYPATHISLISLTRDDSTRPAYVARRRQQTVSVLTRVAQGDPVAARECIDEFGSLIWSIARRLTRNHADAEQAVQEIFSEVWRSADRFDPAQGSEKVFVATIARRRLIDRMRRAARQGLAESDDIHSLSWAGGPCVEAAAAARAVMQVRPELRRVLELGVLRGLNHSEIAEVLRMPVATVKATMLRGLIQVRELMGKQRAAADEVQF